MRTFLRENWVYVVVPLVATLVALVALVLLGGGDGSSFFYNLF